MCPEEGKFQETLRAVGISEVMGSQLSTRLNNKVSGKNMKGKQTNKHNKTKRKEKHENKKTSVSLSD